MQNTIKIRSEQFKAAFLSAMTKAGVDTSAVTVFDYCDQEAWGNSSGYAVYSQDEALEARACEFVYNWHRKYQPRNNSLYPATEGRYTEKPDHKFEEREATPAYPVRKVKVSYYSIGD